VKKKSGQVTEVDIAKLPFRFRSYIQHLQSRVRELEKVQASEEPSLIMLDPYGAKRYLPDRTTVRYGRDDTGRIGEIDVDYRDGELRVSSTNGTLAVYPHVSNVVLIGLRPR
jgi:hypothetical protein